MALEVQKAPTLHGGRSSKKAFVAELDSPRLHAEYLFRRVLYNCFLGKSGHSLTLIEAQGQQKQINKRGVVIQKHPTHRNDSCLWHVMAKSRPTVGSIKSSGKTNTAPWGLNYSLLDQNQQMRFSARDLVHDPGALARQVRPTNFRRSNLVENLLPRITSLNHYTNKGSGHQSCKCNPPLENCRADQQQGGVCLLNEKAKPPKKIPRHSYFVLYLRSLRVPKCLPRHMRKGGESRIFQQLSPTS